MMQVFIPTKGRHDIITTHLVFPQALVVVHTAAERERYAQRVPENRIVVSGVPGDAYGLTRQREWVVNNLVAPGEWFVFADDNIKYVSAVAEPYYQQAQLDVQNDKSLVQAFNTVCPAERLEVLFSEMIALADKHGINLLGFATNGNPFFRGKKYRTIGYVIGKMMLWKNVGIPFDHTITMEDFYYTGYHLLHYGAVLINNFIYPVAGHYQHGGMGTYAERLPYRLADCQNLMRLYPGLFRYKERKGFAPKTDLAVKINSQAALDQWRAGLLFRWEELFKQPRVAPKI
ncbi:MAG: hypothetical protein WBJ84_02685 [Bacteroidales bacterium]